MTKAKSGHVRDRYWREPTVLRYSVGSIIVEPSNLLKVEDADMGEEIGFANVIFVLERMSWMYLCCERQRPFAIHAASTLRIKM